VMDLVELASHLRDRGMSLAAEAQGMEWSDLAYDTILRIAASQPTVHVDDVLAQFSVTPDHPNAWGAVWMRAIRAGVIEHSGTVRPSSDPKKHRHQYPVYRSRAYRGEAAA
jgi:hypothetical protein